MILKTKEIKKFKEASSYIKTNSIMPVLSYIKIADGKICKNNLESFIEMNLECEGAVLIEEKALFSFCEYIKSEEISVEISEKRVILRSGPEKLDLPTEAVSNFPKNPVHKSKEIVFTPEIVKTLDMASNFCDQSSTIPVARCVFVGNGIVAASTGGIGITKPFNDLPQLILEKSTISIIKNLNSVLFSENDSYQFFSTDDFRFGFIKKDTKFVDFSVFMKLPEVAPIEVEKTELLNFCQTCSAISEIDQFSVKLNTLSMVDTDFSINYEKPSPVAMPDFCFRTSFLLKLLSSIPDEKVKFYFGVHRIFITGSSDYICVIAEVQGNA